MINQGLVKARDVNTLPEDLRADYNKYINIFSDIDPDNKNSKSGAKTKEIKETHPFLDKEIAENAQMKVTLVGISMETCLFVCANENGIRFAIELAGIVHTNIASSSPIIRNLISIFFIENLLNRTFLIRIHAKSQNGYIVTLTQGNRNIAATMISKGIVRFNQITANYLSNASHFRALEETAKRGGIGIWADTNYNEQRTKPFHTQIVSIPSSNSFTIINEDGDEELFYFSGIKCPEFSFDGLSDPLGYEAWNFIRQTVLDKEVYITIDDDRADKKFATITIGNECLNVLLAQKGYAQLSVSRVRKNTAKIEEIRNAYLLAQQNQLGIFAEEIPEPVLVKELNKEEREQLMSDEFSRNVKGIVIDVTGSVYMRVFVPSLSAVLRVSLVGLVPLQSNDWTSRRAKQVLRHCFLNHDVDVLITRYAEHSRYFRVLVYESLTKLDARIPAVHEGFVRYNKLATDDPSNNKDELEQHSEEARTKGLGIYKSEGRNASQIPKDKTIPVVVTNVINESTYSIQVQNENQQKVMELMKAEFQQLEIPPMDDQFVVLARNGVNYRAQVVKVRQNECFVHLIDFGIDLWCFVSDLRKYDDSLMQYQPNGMIVSLAFVKPFSHRPQQFTDMTTNYIAKVFSQGGEVYVRRPFDREYPCVQMFLNESTSSMTMQYALVNDGICRVIEEDVHQLFLPMVKELRKVMASAKENKFGGWCVQEVFI